MTQKLFCLCVAALFAVAAANISYAEETATATTVTTTTTTPAADCPCAKTVSPCDCTPVCQCSMCSARACYRVGYRVARPVYYAPVCRPYYYFAPRFYRAPYYVGPYCW